MDETKKSRATSEIYMDDVLLTASGDYEAIQGRISNRAMIDMLHAAMGMATEAGELLDALKKFIFYGKNLDLVNIEEELGDSDWYHSLMIHSMRLMRYSTSWEQIWEKNIKKLHQVRYKKGTFDAADAINRDLELERDILEGRR